VVRCPLGGVDGGIPGAIRKKTLRMLVLCKETFSRGPSGAISSEGGADGRAPYGALPIERPRRVDVRVPFAGILSPLVRVRARDIQNGKGRGAPRPLGVIAD